MSTTYDTVTNILEGLKLGEIAFDQAVQMILTLKAQNKATDEEICEKTKGLIIQGRNLLDTLGNVSLQEEL